MSRYTACCYAIIISSLFFLVSCSKDQIPTVPPPPPPPPVDSTVKPKNTITLVASNWVKDVTYNFYFCNLNRPLPPESSSIIYLLVGNEKKFIGRDGSGLRYMNGSISLKGDTLYYVCNVSTDNIPFSSVEIIIEFK